MKEANRDDWETAPLPPPITEREPQTASDDLSDTDSDSDLPDALNFDEFAQTQAQANFTQLDSMDLKFHGLSSYFCSTSILTPQEKMDIVANNLALSEMDPTEDRWKRAEEKEFNGLTEKTEELPHGRVEVTTTPPPRGEPVLPAL
jgi:hypothetical protein